MRRFGVPVAFWRAGVDELRPHVRDEPAPDAILPGLFDDYEALVRRVSRPDEGTRGSPRA
jgi:hypothetical protein